MLVFIRVKTFIYIYICMYKRFILCYLAIHLLMNVCPVETLTVHYLTVLCSDPLEHHWMTREGFITTVANHGTRKQPEIDGSVAKQTHVANHHQRRNRNNCCLGYQRWSSRWPTIINEGHAFVLGSLASLVDYQPSRSIAWRICVDIRVASSQLLGHDPLTSRWVLTWITINDWFVPTSSG